MNPAAAATAFLVIITPMPTGKHMHVFPYATPEDCGAAAIAYMKIEQPSQAPNGIVVFCSPTRVPLSPPLSVR